MARILQIKRGLKANLPTLAQGEFAMTTDSGAESLYLGNGAKNLKIPLNPTAADVEAVALDGSGVMTGALKFNDGHGQVDAIATRSRMVSYPDPADTTTYASLAVYGAESLKTMLRSYQSVNGVSKQYDLHHTGNKTTGSYTGNGAARTVDTGGIGNALLISRPKLASAFWLVTPGGALKVVGTEVSAINWEYLKFLDGVLYIGATTQANAAATEYTYQVL